MKRQYLLLFAILPAIITVYLYDGASAQDSVDTHSSILGTGHVTVTVKDSIGAITAYHQSDNAVVNIGENCLAKMIFRDPTAAGTVVCLGTTTASWNNMCLDRDAQIYTTDVELRNETTRPSIACAKAAITWNQNSTGGSDALSKVTLRLTKTFSNTDGSDTIKAVGLFNSTSVSTRSMLSKANFTSTVVGTGSSITVNYDFEVGGGTVP